MGPHTVNTDEYLAAEFRPELVANRLVRETTTAHDTSVETGSALTRLKYDIDEIDHRMDALCRDHTEELLAHARRTAAIADEVDGLGPAVEDVAGTVAKLDRDFLDPFNRASDLHGAGERLHGAATLARYLSWYLQLALQAQSEDYKREATPSPEGPGAAMLRNAYAIKTLGKLVAEVPDLRAVQAVARFDAALPALKAALVDAAAALIRGFTGAAPGQLRLAAMTVLALGADLGQIVDAHVRALVGSTVLQMSRPTGGAIDYDQAFEDARKRAAIVAVLTTTKAEVMGLKSRKQESQNKDPSGQKSEHTDALQESQNKQSSTNKSESKNSQYNSAPQRDSQNKDLPQKGPPSKTARNEASNEASQNEASQNKASQHEAASQNQPQQEQPTLDPSQRPFWDALGAQLDQKLRTLSVTNQAAIKAMIANRESILACAQDVAPVHEVFVKYINK